MQAKKTIIKLNTSKQVTFRKQTKLVLNNSRLQAPKENNSKNNTSNTKHFIALPKNMKINTIYHIQSYQKNFDTNNRYLSQKQSFCRWHNSAKQSFITNPFKEKTILSKHNLIESPFVIDRLPKVHWKQTNTPS